MIPKVHCDKHDRELHYINDRAVPRKPLCLDCIVRIWWTIPCLECEAARMAEAGFDVTVLPKKKSARYATTRTIRTTRATQNKQSITSKRTSSAKAQNKSTPQMPPSENTSDFGNGR